MNMLKRAGLRDTIAGDVVVEFKHRLMSIGLLGILASVLLLGNPFFAGIFAQSLLETHQFSTRLIIAAWVLLIVLQSAIRIFTNWLQTSTQERVLQSIRLKIFETLQSQTITYFETNNRGNSLALVFNDGLAIGRFIGSTLTTTAQQVITTLGAFILLSIINPKAGLIMFSLLALFLVVTKLISRHFKAYSKDFYDSYSHLVSFVEESIQMIPIVKSFLIEQRNNDEFASKHEDYVKKHLKYQQRQNLLQPSTTLIGGIFLIIYAWIISSDINNQAITVAEIVSIVMYGTILIRPLGSLAAIFGQFQSTKAAHERIQKLANNSQENYSDATSNLPKFSAPPNIEFTNVCFTYRPGYSVLKDFTATIGSGETVALVGPNGSGKSTLAKLLLRFYDPSDGHITIGGIDTTTTNSVSIRKLIGYVPQTTQLFKGTIRDNLLISNHNHDDKVLLDALRIVGGVHFPDSLNNGLDTFVGESGLTLSGGQCQRIALARTLLKEPKILILDEATSMFDDAAERDYVRACRGVYDKMTVVLISHRRVSLELADRVIELKQIE